MRDEQTGKRRLLFRVAFWAVFLTGTMTALHFVTWTCAYSLTDWDTLEVRIPDVDIRYVANAYNVNGDVEDYNSHVVIDRNLGYAIVRLGDPYSLPTKRFGPGPWTTPAPCDGSIFTRQENRIERIEFTIWLKPDTLGDPIEGYEHWPSRTFTLKPIEDVDYENGIVRYDWNPFDE